jgi:large subunit ribosomal protein L29
LASPSDPEPRYKASERNKELAMSQKGPKMVEIRESTDEELASSLERTRDELFRLKLQRSTNQLENTMQIRAKRREVARLMTVASARKKGLEAKRAPEGEK